jgi:hypothetical protein
MDSAGEPSVASFRRDLEAVGPLVGRPAHPAVWSILSVTGAWIGDR